MKKEHKVSIDHEKCMGCGRCVKDCPASTLKLEDKKATVVKTTCLACAHCVAICPVNAVLISGFPEESMEIKDDFFFFGAPTAIVIMSNNKIDAGLAAANMTLVAEANGLGTLYSGFFTMAVNRFSKLREKLKLTKRDKAAITIVIGYPNVKYHRTALRAKAKVKIL